MVFDFSVERYCPRTNEWQTVAAMHESRSPKDSSLILSSLSSLAALLAAHMIPVSSALWSPNCHYSQHPFYYNNPFQLQHFSLHCDSLPQSLTFVRFGCAVVAHQGRIYVSGGFGQDKVNIHHYFPCHRPPNNHQQFWLAGNSKLGRVLWPWDRQMDEAGSYEKGWFSKLNFRENSIFTCNLQMCGFVGGVLVDRPVHFDTELDP